MGHHFSKLTNPTKQNYRIVELSNIARCDGFIVVNTHTHEQTTHEITRSVDVSL
mgnify:CR=1 FL=1